LKAGGANTGETSVEMANCRNFRMLKVKVKVELRVKVAAAQTTKAQRGVEVSSIFLYPRC